MLFEFFLELFRLFTWPSPASCSASATSREQRVSTNTNIQEADFTQVTVITERRNPEVESFRVDRRTSTCGPEVSPLIVSSIPKQESFPSEVCPPIIFRPCQTLSFQTR
jgi:hypothetical protein